MTNYNDGKWHGWNGGECPVYPMSDVEAIMLNGYRTTLYARGLTWDHGGPSHPGNIIAFRVVKEHREPREWWVWLDMKGLPHFGSSYIPGSFKVREVLE